MPEPSRLDMECRLLGKMLLGSAPSAYLVEKYAAAHSATALFHPRDSRDDALLALALESSLRARLCDAHARLFAPRAAIRRKLILIMAIAETSASEHGISALQRSRRSALSILALVPTGIVGIVLAIAGTIFVRVRLRAYAGAAPAR